MQQGRERCGLTGRFVKNQAGEVVFKVESHITAQEDPDQANGMWSLPVEFEIGEEIPIEQIVSDYRGVVIYDEGFVREGEIEKRGGQYVLVSDYDDDMDIELGRVADLELQVKLKPEIYDPEGAAKRLRFLKLNLGGFFEDGLE